MKEKKTAADLKNWKVSAETLRSVNIECATRGVTQAKLAEVALASYMDQKEVEVDVSDTVHKITKGGVHAPPPKPPSTGNPDPRQSALIASALRAEIDKDEESEIAKMAAIAIAALELYGRRAGTIGNKPGSGQNEDRKTEGHRGARRLNRSQGVDNAGDKAPGEDSFKRGDGERLG
jgi:hypothetical protein